MHWTDRNISSYINYKAVDIRGSFLLLYSKLIYSIAVLQELYHGKYTAISYEENKTERER